MSGAIPVSVIVVTRNEGARIAACLKALQRFDQILVVDSGSRDETVSVSKSCGAEIVPFVWNGEYPKKRQWCLDHLPLNHDWVFFVDADEMMTPNLEQEIADLFNAGEPPYAGYFVTGRYVLGEKVLRFGVPNSKIALFDRRKMEFPVVDDLDIPGMGEIEGHYQPVLKADSYRVGSLENFLLHDALGDERAWVFRHEKYARWEAGMTLKNVWPLDPVPWREKVKRILRGSKFRPELMFLLSYVGKLGVLDGAAGLKLAVSKYRYYKLIHQIEDQKK